jgi:ABC-type molybdate transport system substrate-binding protein
MKKPLKSLLVVVLLALAPAGARAQALSIFADQAYQPVLGEILPQFSEQTGFEVQLSLGRSTILAERLRSGIPADVFFPASEESMNQVMEKGLVDVALKRNILILPAVGPVEEGIEPEPQQIAAAVLANSSNRVPAMAFVEFLTSEPARAAFSRAGFALP